MDQFDQILHCVDCGRDFIFTVAEQLFYQSKQLSQPKRCRECRAERKARLVPDATVQHGH
jgi:DNA-directed RNA polymerase subunit RPC12/RpoP